MAKSPAERQRAYKQRLKEKGLYKEWQERVRIAKRRERSRARMTKAGAERLKLQSRNYRQAKRKRDNLARVQEVDNRAETLMPDTGFRIMQHYGKCRKSVEEVLTSSPTLQVDEGKHDPEWILENEEEGSSSCEPGHKLQAEDDTIALQEGEDELTPVTEIVIKEEPVDPTLDNSSMITQNEENVLENVNAPTERAKGRSTTHESEQELFVKTCTGALKQCDDQSESAAFGKFVATKHAKLSQVQRMYAESLITNILNKAILNTLTEYTNIVEVQQPF